MFATLSYGQTGYRLVHDSMVVITPQQDIFFISQSFTVKELSTSLVLKDRELSTTKQENNFLRLEVIENKKTIDLQSTQNTNCQEDKKFISDQLNKANRGKRLLKTGFIITASVAVIELGYIGLLKITR